MAFDDFGGAFGGAMAAGEEAQRRRRQNAAMDDYLRGAGVGPERQMRVDPASAGPVLEQILRNPAPAAPAAAAASPLEAPRGPSYAAQAVADAPRMQFGAGSFAPVFTPSDPVIGAGINVRDSEETQLAKMGIKRQGEMAALEAMNAAERNRQQGRATDVALFDTQTRTQDNRDKMRQDERFQADESRRHAEGLRSAEGIAAARERGESDRERFKVGPEATAAAEKVAILRAIAENPAQAQKILAAITQLKGGATAGPAGPIPGAPAGDVQTGPNFIQRFYHNLGALGPNIVPGAGDTFGERFNNTRVTIRPELVGQYDNSPYLAPLGVYKQR